MSFFTQKAQSPIFLCKMCVTLLINYLALSVEQPNIRLYIIKLT
ncbi:hypothetical protein YPPY64_1549, partial [Yersinia pestis PY-64]